MHIVNISQEGSDTDAKLGITWRTVDYDDSKTLVEALRGIHTVLSFVNTSTDSNNNAQKKLIDACVTAGVKRFAPSEYGW